MNPALKALFFASDNEMCWFVILLTLAAMGVAGLLLWSLWRQG